MKCPTCATENLVMSERQGIEIDYCPVCRGVWLDRGELDKIIDRVISEGRSTQQAPPPTGFGHVPPPPPASSSFGHMDYKHHDHHKHHYGHHKHHKHHKKDHWFDDLFD